MLNEPGYEWPEFWHDLQAAGVTVWGAAVDTLENTSRFAMGTDTGPLTVIHLFDQPLRIARPYEGYMGNLVLPRTVVERAAERSVLIDFLTPRALVMEAIRNAYPGIRPEHVHVWTLGGPSRTGRIGSLWQAWRELGAHVVEDGWTLPPTGGRIFTDSGTYAPVFQVGTFEDDEGHTHLFLCDGYAASAEAQQAASLDPVLDLQTSLCLFSSRFEVPWDREPKVMRLDPEADAFPAQLADILGGDADVDGYREIIRNARDAGMPVDKRTFTVDDFFPDKQWRVLALAGYMLPDPYTGAPGVEEVRQGVYRATVRAATRLGILEVTLTLRLMEPYEEMRLVFSPLLDRFYGGQDFRTRPVKVSDSGRIRNELQTLASEALEYLPDDRIRVDFGRIDNAVLPEDKKALILEVLHWYKTTHPVWFTWLDIA